MNTLETKIGVSHVHTKECLGLPQAGRGKEEHALETLLEYSPADTLLSNV